MFPKYQTTYFPSNIKLTYYISMLGNVEPDLLQDTYCSSGSATSPSSSLSSETWLALMVYQPKLQDRFKCSTKHQGFHYQCGFLNERFIQRDVASGNHHRRSWMVYMYSGCIGEPLKKSSKVAQHRPFEWAAMGSVQSCKDLLISTIFLPSITMNGILRFIRRSSKIQDWWRGTGTQEHSWMSWTQSKTGELPEFLSKYGGDWGLPLHFETLPWMGSKFGSAPP